MHPAGLAIGVVTSVVIGVAIDNIAVGISIGMSIGVFLGTAMYGNEEMGVSKHPSTRNIHDGGL